MTAMKWSSLPSGVPAFQLYRRDDAVVRTLQGSQVALHEHRMAYENLLAAIERERDSWARDRVELEDEVRSLAVQKAEMERQLKEALSHLQEGYRAADAALRKLGVEHQHLQRNSENIANTLLQRIDDLQGTVAELQDKSQSLQSELAAVQADAAIKDEALRQVAELQANMAALQDRANLLVDQLKHERAVAEAHIKQLAGDLDARNLQLVRETQARMSSDDAAKSMASDRERLLAALQLERLINEPLRHTHYATSTVLAHVLRSPIAPTVKDRAATRLRSQPPASILTPLDVPVWGQGHHRQQPRQVRPSSAPPARPASKSGLTRDPLASFRFSPVTARGPAAACGPPPGTVKGRNLTRLGRSWATTTTAAGPPHPYYLDNLNSHLTPPPPGPPRRSPSTAASPRSGTPRSPSAVHRGATGGRSTAAATPETASATGGSSSGAEKPGAKRHKAPADPVVVQSPTYLTSALRSPSTPATEGWGAAVSSGRLQPGRSSVEVVASLAVSPVSGARAISNRGGQVDSGGRPVSRKGKRPVAKGTGCGVGQRAAGSPGSAPTWLYS